MPMTNAYRDFLAQGSVEAATLFNNANARIGVGDSNTAFAASQTDLQAATNKFRKGMDANYPQRSANVMTFKATFASAEANFAWQEWGVFNAAAGGVMMNRKVEYNGTKLPGQTWVLEVTNTISIGS